LLNESSLPIKLLRNTKEGQASNMDRGFALVGWKKGLSMKTKVEVASRSEKIAKKKAKTNPKAKASSKKTQVLGDAEVAALILEHRDNGRKLARSILRRWRVRMPAEEIDSTVDLALCEAARRYNPDKGAAFMTFLFYHLRGHLVRSVAKAAQATNIFLAFGPKTDDEEKKWQHVSSEPLWSFAPEHLLFGQRDAETPENVVLRQEKIDQCREAVTKLDDLEKEIITRSFGSEQPLVDIARNLGYSRCHISRVKKSALNRLEGILAESREEQVSDENQGAVKEILAERNALGRGRPRRRSRRRTLNRTNQDETSREA